MIFITATDTDVGKTFVSNRLIKAALKEFKAQEIAYYKPLQCGMPTDYDQIKKDNPDVEVFCSYCFDYPGSPNLAATLEDRVIELDKIREDFELLKSKYKFVLVEGAGGLAVPLNNYYSETITEEKWFASNKNHKDQNPVQTNYYVSDIPKLLSLPTLLISRPDLGTLNHSLLSIEHARSKDLDLMGVYVNDLDASGNKVDFSKEEVPAHIKTAPEIIANCSSLRVYTQLDKLIQENKAIFSPKVAS